jgi:hypothetical protein
VAGPASAEVLAGRTGAHAPSLRRLLRSWPAWACSPNPSPASSP